MDGIQRVQEFVAHSANVTCLALGHKSGGVLVTGGDDRNVNLWAVGKSNCIISLSGHVTPIQCVRFGHTENTVCAGSAAGALKVWDLEACRLLRTLTGHKNAIRCVEFHPYGDFLTSGSKDTSIKLWDIRRKGCIFTYKGHTEAVNSLKFSPDGQWIASAGHEGIVKLWDLRMGKMLRQFSQHTGPVNAVEFHPHEFLLASASMDNSINFWDLEHFTLVSSTGFEASPSRCMLFSNNGDMLYSGASDYLHVYGWEPARTLMSKVVPWGRVRDMALSLTEDKVMAASFHSSSVSIWVIETSELSKSSGCFSADLDETPSPRSNPFVHGNSLRKSFNKERPSPEVKKNLSFGVKTIEESERSETDPEDDVQPEIHNVKDYRAVFQPSRSLNRSPPISIYEAPRPESVTPSKSLKSTLSQSFSTEPTEELHDGTGDGNFQDPPTNQTFTIPSENVLSPIAESHSPLRDEEFPLLKPEGSSTPTKYSDLPSMANVLMERRRRSLSPSPASTAEPPLPADAEEFLLPSGVLPVSPVASSRYQQSRNDTSTAQVRRHSVCRDAGPSAYSSTGSLPTGASRLAPSSSSVHLGPDYAPGPNLNAIHHSSSESNVPRAASVQSQRLSSRHGRSVSQSSKPLKPMLRETKSDRGGELSSSPNISPPRTPEDEFIPMSSERPTGLDFNEFLPKSYHKRMNYAHPIQDMSEAEVLSSMMRGHDSIIAILEARNRNLQIVHTLWHTKDLKAAVDAAVNMDNSVIVDFLSIITLRPAMWNLDVCVAVLPTIFELLQSRFETHMRAGCDALRLILRNFSPVIKTNVLSGSAGLGVDIPREERYQKCIKCYNILVSIRAFLLKRQTLQGPLGQSFRELHVSLQAIDVK
ncbi:Katanin P80 [Nesidiocoris tenuis]|uniref:Katanin p80 WD40 repeat-containing subunit B1 n=1 Tax=Nesidiocoris tenuis TaxID=355587 RepID=A0ABN7A814_9HEMI|nr:Katanin P80 [Nesidiocoris tenuis]